MPSAAGSITMGSADAIFPGIADLLMQTSQAQMLVEKTFRSDFEKCAPGKKAGLTVAQLLKQINLLIVILSELNQAAENEANKNDISLLISLVDIEDCRRTLLEVTR